MMHNLVPRPPILGPASANVQALYNYLCMLAETLESVLLNDTSEETQTKETVVLQIEDGDNPIGGDLTRHDLDGEQAQAISQANDVVAYSVNGYGRPAYVYQLHRQYVPEHLDKQARTVVKTLTQYNGDIADYALFSCESYESGAAVWRRLIYISTERDGSFIVIPNISNIYAISILN